MSSSDPSGNRARKLMEARRALATIKEYIQDGRIADVLEASEKQISANTLRSWVSEPSKIANAYKFDELIRLGSKLSPLIDKNQMAYDLALKEWDAEPQSQDKASELTGTYRIVHSLPKSYTNDMDTISFNLIFGRTYKNFYFRYHANKNLRKCDGFIFLADARIILAGISPRLIFFACYTMEADEFPYFGEGYIVIEDAKESLSFFSKSAIMRENIEGDDYFQDKLRIFAEQNAIML